jgi:DNA-binding MarR family transcriptional regulator
MIKDKTMLNEAIQDADILSSGQKRVLSVICDSNYPVSASSVLDLMGTSKQAVHFSIQKLLERNFITRTKDRVFVYQPNKTRVIELVDRYSKKLLVK